MIGNVSPQTQEVGVAESDPTWIARVRPPAGKDVASLMDMSLGLDVWERHADFLVVAVPESLLAELERRRLAVVDRWASAADYEARMRKPAASGDDSDRGT
jgi:hypothetical protein